MKLLKEIVRVKGMCLEGRIIYREAVRGIIADKTKLLMIYCTKNGAYKFPGGGIADRETHQETLAREIREECGTLLTNIGPPFGKVIEYDVPVESEYTIFKMTSFYYLCQIENSFFEQQLEQYEQDLGFQPVWVEIDAAICKNKKITPSSLTLETRWISREIYVLEQYQKRSFIT